MDRHGAASVALATLLAAATAFGALLRAPDGSEAGRRLVARAILTPLKGWDRLHADFDPHLRATREALRRDERPLRVQAAEMGADLRRRFLARGRYFLISTPPVEIGDACLWQGVFAATAALEYDLDRTPAKRARAEEAFEGLAALGRRGRPIARSVLPLEVRTEEPGAWSARDDKYQWKEDASVDSAAGWMLGMLTVAELLPTRREAALTAVGRFADQLMAGGYMLRNSDGTATRYGSAGGNMISSPVGLLVTLSALSTLTRHGRGGLYAEARARFLRADQHRWAAYASGPALGRNLTTNHNIAFLGLTAALLAEDDPDVAVVYGRGLLRLARVTDKMDNAFWIYLSDWALSRAPELAVVAGDDPDFLRHRAERSGRWARARRAMQEWHYPAQKLKIRRSAPPGEPEPREPLPIYDRPAADFAWQRSPYEREGWPHERPARGQAQAYSPLDFLSAYALGRSVGALGAAD
jgi:hypothetical protein